MKTIGIIAEYNPFHRGHASQYMQLREKLGEDTAIVVALSSFFCQRGIPALQSLRSRTYSALKGGADLVLLLPQQFSCAAAEDFAKGGVSLLAATGIVQMLACGSEVQDKEAVIRCASRLAPESDELKEAVKASLREGCSAHEARGIALRKIYGDEPAAACLDYPNARLAVEYCAQLRLLPEAYPQPGFFLCTRSGSAENQEQLSDEEQASAGALRRYVKALYTQQKPTSLEDIERLLYHMPSCSLGTLLEDLGEGRLLFSDKLSEYALFNLELQADVLTRHGYRYLDKGLPERLLHLISRRHSEHTAEYILTQAKSRNFTEARIRRALLSLMLGFDRSYFEAAGSRPAFIYPLGFSKRGRYLLKRMKEKSRLPILSRFSEAESLNDPVLLAQVRAEHRAASLRALLCPGTFPDLLSEPVQIRK